MATEDMKQSPPTASTVRAPQLAFVLAAMLGAVLLVGCSDETPATSGGVASPKPSVGLASSHAPALAQQSGFAAQNPPEVAAKAAASVLAKLRSDPDNFDLLTQAGNIYLHSRVFSGAVEYYEKALRVKDDVTVRNDYGNALFYSGDVDRALQQYETVLRSDPRNANALFNRGMVRWRGQHDPQGAIASWKVLLKDHPDDARRSTVEAMITQAQRHASRKTQ